MFLFLVPRMPPQPSLPKIQNKNNNKKKKVTVPITCLERAMVQCNWILIEKEHDDIDLAGTSVSTLTKQQKIYLGFGFIMKSKFKQ